MRPVRTIGACAAHLPVCLAEVVVSYITPVRAGLRAAVAVGNYEICSMTDATDFALFETARHGYADITRMFLAKPPAIRDGWKAAHLSVAFCIACSDEHREVLAVLQEHGATGMCSCNRPISAHLPGLQAGGRNGSSTPRASIYL